MAGSYPLQSNPGSFVPTTNIWDVSQLYDVEIGSPEFKELLVRLYQNINNIAISLNTRDAGYYVHQEFVNGQLFFPNEGMIIGTTDGAGNASGTVPGGYGLIGQRFSIGAQFFTATVTNGALTTVGAGTGTFNTITGAYTFAGAAATTSIFFYPTVGSASGPSKANYRQVFRAVVNFGALPNAGSKSVAHNIPITASITTFSFTRIYATASDQAGRTFIPIPYASNSAGAPIELSVDATNVTITTGSDRTNYTVCYVVLEYLKN